METKQEQPNNIITLSVRDLIYCILGGMHIEQDSEMCKPIPHSVAILLSSKLREQDSQQWIVEFEDGEGKPHRFPLLWRYSEWQTAASTYNKRKIYAHKERVDGGIREANVNNLCRALSKTSGLSMESSRPFAYKLIQTGNLEVLKAMGLSKLISKEEEL